MDKSCSVCNGEGTYKCPTCLIFYCSVQCCRKHRETGCDVWIKNDAKTLQQPIKGQSNPRYTTADTVALDKLTLLREDENLKSVLSNPHLRDLLVKINNSKEPEKIMEIAMQEPLFVEFADACLTIIDPPQATEGDRKNNI